MNHAVSFLKRQTDQKFPLEQRTSPSVFMRFMVNFPTGCSPASTRFFILHSSFCLSSPIPDSPSPIDNAGLFSIPSQPYPRDVPGAAVVVIALVE
jgi:hypothetical protein